MKDPDTGEINWDCPCLGDMPHGVCGEQFRKAFDNLRKEQLIRGIVDIFGKIRLIISEESIRDLIDKIWAIHGYQLSILHRKMNYLEEPNEREAMARTSIWKRAI